MEKVNWKQKLSSRKFWAALVGVVTAIGAAFGVADSVITQIVAIVSGIGVLAVYILAEAKIDAASASSQIKVVEEDIDDYEEE